MLKTRWVLIVGGCGLFLLLAVVRSSRRQTSAPTGVEVYHVDDTVG